MAEKDKKYYWLKLKRDFFKRHDIQIIEDMPNGKDYILFYLKLLCESVDHDGNLRFNAEIPYNEEMLATITRTNIDTIRSAIKVFKQLKMIEILSDGTIFMREVNKMLGSETYWAEKKRLQRKNDALLDNVQQVSNACPTCPSKSIDKEIEKDKELETEKEIDRDKDYLINNKNNNISLDSKAVFDCMLEELKKLVSYVTYQTFFETLKLKGIRGNKIALSSASNLTANTIDSNFKEKLNTAITTASEGQLVGYVWEE